MAVLDGTQLGITLDGIPIRRVVLDSGANEPMIHRSVQAQRKAALQADGKSIIGISGQPSLMPRTQEELTIRLHTGDHNKEASGIARWVVMDGKDLPELLLDTELMAMMGLRLDPVTWSVTYSSKPYLPDSPEIVIQLARPTRGELAALAELAGEEVWPAGWMDAEPAEGEAAEEQMNLLGGSNYCFTAVAAAQQIPNFQSEVGGGRHSSRQERRGRNFFFSAQRTAAYLPRDSHRRIRSPFTGLGGRPSSFQQPIP